MAFNIKQEISDCGIKASEILKHLEANGIKIDRFCFNKIINGTYNRGTETPKTQSVIDLTIKYIVRVKREVAEQSADMYEETEETIKMCLTCTKPRCSGSRHQFAKCINYRRDKLL